MRMIFIDDDDYDEKGGWVQEWQSVPGQRPLSTVFPSTLQWSSSLLRFLCQGVFSESWSFLLQDRNMSLHTAMKQQSAEVSLSRCFGTDFFFLESWSFLSRDTHLSLYTLHWSRTLRWSHEVLRFVQQSLLRLRWKRLPMHSWPYSCKVLQEEKLTRPLESKVEFWTEICRWGKRKPKMFLWVFWHISITFSIHNDCYGYLKRFWLKCRELRQKLLLVLRIKSFIASALEICTEQPANLQNLETPDSHFCCWIHSLIHSFVINV